jgi:phage tail sheath protein FI
MLVAAGMAINNPFMNKLETLNTQVMQAMLNVCEARKDCFALFDGVSEPDIAKALKKEIAATGFVSTIGRWGMLYDGRGLVQDSIYTNGEAEIMKSIQMANIITGNRQSGIYWEPPSGYDKAPIPSAWGTKEKFTRTYSAEDKNCDVAKLNDIHVNATRVNREGMCIWGDFTLQMEDTAFNQAHVAMLVAGIHKTFYKYLDHKVFRLNTTNLRAQITSDLQDKLNMIKRANPQGLIDGIVICNDTNNTPELIDQNFLIVDVKLWPTKSARWIILRTSVESTQNGNNISTEIISG